MRERNPDSSRQLRRRRAAVLLAVAWLGAAACTAQQTALVAPLAIAPNDDSTYMLVEAIEIRAKNAAKTRLKAGTTWRRVGNIEQGDVYSTKDQVVVVNSYNVFEAYIVVSDAQIVGYYLPVEESFVQSEPVPIELTKQETSHEN